jgi:flavin-dependent dehydrogenase
VRTADVIVIGAGPAGCAAAIVLAEAGRSVLVIDRPRGDRRALAESIPPSARRVLTELGVDGPVSSAGFQPWRGNTVWWADAPPRVERFAPEAVGFQVDRHRFDAVLRDAAVRAGAEIIAGTVRAVTPPVVIFDVDGREDSATAPWILDGSGRAGVLARQGSRTVADAPRTVALAGIWRATMPWPAAYEGHTLVASHADGWAWSVPVARDVRYVTVMVDPARSHLTRDAPALAVYQAELSKVLPFADLVATAQLDAGPWGADASLYGARHHAGPGFLLVGDAATFIDPLSSFGVKKALTSGWLAAIVISSILDAPTMQDAALEFFESRERQVASSFRRQAARYAEDAGARHPFWQARAVMAQADVADVGDLADAADEHAAIMAALRDLQQRPSLSVRQGDEVTIIRRALIRGRRLVMEDHVSLPMWPEGVRYIRNVDVLLVLRLALEHRDVGDLYESIVRVQPGVGLPDVLGVLATLLARGALQHKM